METGAEMKIHERTSKQLRITAPEDRNTDTDKDTGTGIERGRDMATIPQGQGPLEASTNWPP